MARRQTAADALQAGDRQYLPVFKHMWDEIDRLFDPAFIFTNGGHAFIQTYAIKSAHPELPWGVHFLATLAALSNGATTKIFPSSNSPLFLFHLNVNYAQTRKSSITGNADVIGDMLDKKNAERIKHKFDELLRKEREDLPEGGRAPQRHARPAVVSSLLHSATPEAFFLRCSGDFQQISNAQDVDFEELERRHHYGVLVNLDEAYDLLLSFGLLSDGDKPAKQASKVNPHQSSFNKLIQYGQASRATKSCGAYGLGVTSLVTVGCDGNMHPSMYIPMEKGESGSHHAACKERFVVSTRRPVQPHEPLPSDYLMQPGEKRALWIPLPLPVAEVFGLADGMLPDIAKDLWPRVRSDGDDPDPQDLDEHEQDCDFVPNASGYHVTLADGVSTQLRFRRDADEKSGYEAEWLISNRDFAVPPAHSLQRAVTRIVDYFANPHQVIDFTPKAKKLMKSYQASFNVLSKLSRDGSEIAAGARWGAAPWLLGNCSGLLLCWDIFIGIYDDDPCLGQKSLKATEDHVARAYSLLTVLFKIKDIAVKEERVSRDDESAAKRAQDIDAALAAADALDTAWDRGQFQAFSQALGSPGAAPALATTLGEQSLPVDNGKEEEEEKDDEGEADADDGADHELEAAIAAEREADDERDAFDGPPDLEELGAVVKPLTLADVKATTFGYGPEGASVQPQPLHNPALTDRAIMLKTLTYGKPVIPEKQIRDCLRSSRAGGRTAKALPREAWLPVMLKGLEGRSVAKLQLSKCEDKKKAGAYEVCLREIPESKSERIKYHNELMTMCSLSLRDLTKALAAGAEKAARERPQAAPGGDQEAARGRSRSARRGT